MTNSLDKSWHLANTPLEIQVTEMEFQFWRLFYGFIRWQEENENAANDIPLTGLEVAILHIIRMGDKPKTAYDICRLLNRDDKHNVEYCIRKLLAAELIKKIKVNPKNLAFEITEKGIKDTDMYTEARRSILMELFKKEKGINLEETAHTLTKLRSIYDEASRLASSYKFMPRQAVTDKQD